MKKSYELTIFPFIRCSCKAHVHVYAGPALKVVVKTINLETFRIEKEY